MRKIYFQTYIPYIYDLKYDNFFDDEFTGIVLTLGQHINSDNALNYFYSKKEITDYYIGIEDYKYFIIHQMIPNFGNILNLINDYLSDIQFHFY